MLELGKGLILTGAATLNPARRKSASSEILAVVSKEYHDFVFLFEALAVDKLLEHKL
jgi:hypothetical protein